MRSLQFTVPLVPPSVNHYVKHTSTGKHYVTAEAKAFKAAVVLLSRKKPVDGPTYGVELFVFLAAGQKLDLDNCAKVCLDGLKDAGVIHSDAAVTCLAMFKDRDATAPRTEFKVWSR